jgi:two-component system OmpR family sensor kinase
MKRLAGLPSLLLLLVGAASWILIPLFWQPEPVLVLRVGLGAGVFALLLVLALLWQAGLALAEWAAERAVQQVTRERDEAYRRFLRRLDHELKNPLTGLQAAMTNLRESGSPEDTRAAVDNASQAAGRLGRILRDLRKLAELDASMLEQRPLDVGELVTDMVAAAGSLPQYQGRIINLLVSRVPALPAVTGDVDMLGLAIYNLLDNALKYSRPGDAVEVRVREDGHGLFIEVADGGVGVPLADQARIFEDLYRGDNAREVEGSGLGLALARRVVQLHGGEISLRSDVAQGRGTVFTIRLPVA